ncbi:PREDICTED: dnaJ homolog subfamily C GRV2-like [Fragaria vesca subsp. vesca]|uniref:dnaJ homolog subfamily C GRV2-like n=1 Tax=Fragaria vesca subsp. vesca TaxID=101020 RepID=UPI0002C2E8C0|nr:PREDICTED: dnaJ homolog subfamily C GRV2-like [Fragaria vesca subsp. vesca]
MLVFVRNSKQQRAEIVCRYMFGQVYLSSLNCMQKLFGLGEHGDAVSRQLILTKVSVAERRPEDYEAVMVRPLSAVNALVRFTGEPQMFAIEFNDGCPIHVYIQAPLVIAYLGQFVICCKQKVNML